MQLFCNVFYFKMIECEDEVLNIIKKKVLSKWMY